MRHAKSVATRTVLLAAVALGVSFGIGYYFDASFSDAAFIGGMLLLLSGLLSSMKGIAFGNHLSKQDNDLPQMDTLEAEREHQNIKSQGTVNYARNNRTVRFRVVPFALALAGVVVLAVSYLIV